MKKGKILLSFALLCSPFWLTAAQNSGTSQNSSAASSISKISSSQSSRASAASQSSAPSASNPAANSTAPQSGSATNSTLQGSDDDNLGTINVTGKADLSTTEGTGSYTTGNMSTATGLNLSIRETPQSISVISNQLLKDMSLHNAEEALSKYITTRAAIASSRAAFMWIISKKTASQARFPAPCSGLLAHRRNLPIWNSTIALRFCAA